MSAPKDFYPVEIIGTLMHTEESEPQYALRIHVAPIPQETVRKLFEALRPQIVEFLISEGVVDPEYVAVQVFPGGENNGSFH